MKPSTSDKAKIQTQDKLEQSQVHIKSRTNNKAIYKW